MVSTLPVVQNELEVGQALAVSGSADGATNIGTGCR